MKSQLNWPTSLIAFCQDPSWNNRCISTFEKAIPKSLHAFKKNLAPLWEDTSLELGKARFRRRSTDAPNLTNQLRTAKERRLNQFGTAVLVRCGKSVWCGKSSTVCRTFVELNVASTHGAPSESHVAPVQSRTYSVRFGTWKVRRLNQA